MANTTRSGSERVAGDLRSLYGQIGEVYRERTAEAWQSYLQACSREMSKFLEQCPRGQDPVRVGQDLASYWVDAGQRSILFWDTLRRRGNEWLEHEAAGKPPLLDFPYEVVADARTFERKANYVLLEIQPPEGAVIDPERRPFVIIDPRAGHGPGIGGFKQDSQVGVALRAGHPVYFVAFYPEPVPGQTLADVSFAEAEFLRIIGQRHPHARKPVVVGNCQGGWATMLLGALEPDLAGPLVINGAPMSYWAGNDGENPMRYAGGVLGGLWPALFASDLGGGTFDGALLVDNFEYLNPANTFFDKAYNLYAKIDTEPERYLEFERWWGGFFMLDRSEIRWIVENLFVGNRLASGEAEWSEGRAFDLKEIRSPIILFASLGDNITPPQQAFFWVLDLYKSTDELKANGQVIVGLTHKSVGHLGIFVSGQVAKREHSQIFDVVEYIEHLAPGVYSMQIEESRKNGEAAFDVSLTEVRLEDLAKRQRFGRRDERAFDVVADASEKLASAYETLVHPVLKTMINPDMARIMRMFHPQRFQRWAISDLNPALMTLGRLAEMTRAHRAPRKDGLPASAESLGAGLVSSSLDLYRDLRDAAVENMFFSVYSPGAFREMSAQARAEPEPEPAFDMRSAALVQAALAGITEGGRTEAAVRTALLLMKAGTHRRQLSAMKRARELVGADVGLLDMPGDRARAIVRDQSFIVELEPERALDTLPELLKGSGDRDFLLGLLERLEGQIDANDGQRALLARIKADLSGSGMIGSDRPKAPAAAMVRGEPQARRPRMTNDERKRR